MLARSLADMILLLHLAFILFALFELVPRLRRLSVGRKYLVLGGLLSGFFYGLALHSAEHAEDIWRFRAGEMKG